MTAISATELREQQMQQAEELLFSGPERAGFAKGLYLGQFRAESLFPWPTLGAGEQQEGDDAVRQVREYAVASIDAAAIDRTADIPPEVIRGLGDLGVLGMTVGREYGGRAFSQKNYCRVMEVIGGHCAATAVFVNAHHSIGLRALELFGTPEQKERWMRPLATGEQLAAFALTEPEAGSDASNVQTRATPVEDGAAFVLDGEKRYITNGAIADVLTVMARTPDDDVPDGRITAFLVTPDMEGFEVVEPRMEKCGIRGTATAKLAFRNMRVPRENILGEEGRGLKLALTVLDFGRTTFGASCTGAAKFCVERATAHAVRRRQFGKSLGEFELVQRKIAEAAADTYAMESATWYTAELIDSGAEDYMLETAMLKVFASDMLWRIVNDTLQIYGGAGYFSEEPFERMMRDARINLIGEGANDVLRCFIAMVGLRTPALQMQSMLRRPWEVVKLWRARPHVPRPAHTAASQVAAGRLETGARVLQRQIHAFGRACRSALMNYRENILDAQFVQARLGDAASELFAASCVYARLCALVENPAGSSSTHDGMDLERQLQTGLLSIRLADTRNRARLRQLTDNTDLQEVQVAGLWQEAAKKAVVAGRSGGG